MSTYWVAISLNDNFRIMNVLKIFSKDEVRQLMQRNNWKAAWEVMFTWGLIIATFVLVGLWPNAFTVAAAFVIIGGRQLALAILMHDTSHNALFKTKKQNQLVGKWLCGAPIWHDMEAYRTYHLSHHQHTGTVNDPDLHLKAGYPTSPKSFARKIGRDISGVSGIKAHFGIVMMHLGNFKYQLGGLVERIDNTGKKYYERLRYGAGNLAGPIIINTIIFITMLAFGQPWLYLIWIGSMLTTAMLFARVRSIAEHAITPDTTDPLNNTRTTYARWYERLLFAPHHVNYHLEHHLMPAVAPYNLRTMHQMLKKRGLLDNACVETSYWNIFRKAWGGKEKAT